MAGGEGTRLRPLSLGMPKPMVPLLGRPVMEHIIGLLKRHGIDEIAVTLCYMHVAQGDGDLVDPVALEQADDVFHHRPAQQRDHGLRHAQGQGAQAGPLSARHNDSFHDVFPPFRPGSAGAERERPCICSIS